MEKKTTYKIFTIADYDEEAAEDAQGRMAAS